MFEEIYIRSKELFKDSPLMWLKELTGALNTHLHSVQQADHTFHGNPEGKHKGVTFVSYLSF